MIDRFLLFGASGDLAGRYVLPALAVLRAEGYLPEGFRVLGAGRTELDNEKFRRSLTERLEHHAAQVPAADRGALVSATRYRQVDVEDPARVAQAVQEAKGGAGETPIAAYLALPPGLFAPTIRALGAVGLPGGSRIVVEKPFGEDLQSAVELNALLARACGNNGESGAFRVDHFLGLASVQNLLGMRLANRVLGPVWNSNHVEEIEVVWQETLGLEGRAGYYDNAGQLKDMIQNHLLQVLCLLTMEPPDKLGEPELSDNKVTLLRAVRPPRSNEVAARTTRARYTAGRVGDRELPAYVDEPGVDPERATETFAELVLEIDNERWAGTRFVVRTGKALGRSRLEVAARFRPAPNRVPGEDGTGPIPNELRIGLDDVGAVTLHLNGAAAGSPPDLAPIALTGAPPPSRLPAYSRVLLDILTGGSTLSVRGDEVEEAWRIVSPVLEAWQRGDVPMREYPAGTDGPVR